MHEQMNKLIEDYSDYFNKNERETLLCLSATFLGACVRYGDEAKIMEILEEIKGLSDDTDNKKT